MGERFLVFLAVAAAVELFRYLTYGSGYSGAGIGLVFFSLLFNLGYHLWSMPSTYLKVAVSAFYNQLTLPYVCVALFRLLLEVWAALHRLLLELIPRLPQ